MPTVIWALCDGFGLAPLPLLSCMAKCESIHEVQRVVFFVTFHFMLPSLACSKTPFQKFPLFFITSKVRVYISARICDARLLQKHNNELNRLGFSLFLLFLGFLIYFLEPLQEQLSGSESAISSCLNFDA